MDAMGFAASAQTDNFGKRRCLVNLFLDVGARARRSGGSAGSSRSGGPRKVSSYQRTGYFGTTTGTGGRFLGENSVNQILNRIGFGDHSIRQAHTAGIAQPQHQFHALQAAQAELPLQVRAGTSPIEFFQAPRPAQLDEQLTHRRQCLRFYGVSTLEFRSSGAHRIGGESFVARTSRAFTHGRHRSAEPSTAARFVQCSMPADRRQFHSEGVAKRARGTFVPGPNEPSGLSTPPSAKGT